MGKKKKNKNTQKKRQTAQQKTYSPKTGVTSQQTQSTQKEQRVHTEGRYVAQKKRMRQKEREKSAEEIFADVPTASSDADEPSGLVLAVENGAAVDTEKKNSEKQEDAPRKRERRKKGKRERPPKAKPSKEKPSKEKPPVKTLSEAAHSYDEREDAEYMKKLGEIQEWEQRFTKRITNIFIAAFIILVVSAALWRIEVGRISVEGREDYELGINVFRMVSTVYKNNPSAMIKESPVRVGTVKIVINRIIDDMYNPEKGTLPYDDGEPILIGFYKADREMAYFETHDYSRGRADMQLRRITKEDKINASKYAVNIGRAALIREYTEKYGGDPDSNFEKLRTSKIIEIIDRDAVTREATEAVAEIFSDRLISSGSDVAMVIRENNEVPEMPAETIAPVAPPVNPAPTAAAVKRTKPRVTPKKSTGSSNSSAGKSTASTANGTPEPSKQQTADAPTPKPEPVRPTPHPVQNEN